MGQAIFFNKINFSDAISATANTNGFTPLLAIARAYDLDRDSIKKAAEICNIKQEICVFHSGNKQPTLFLVPRTRGNGDTRTLAIDLIRAIEKEKIANFHFTHYGFIQNKFPIDEFLIAIDVILNYDKNINFENIIVDIDSRFQNDVMNNLFFGSRERLSCGGRSS